MENILLVNQPCGQCGVYQFGKNIYDLVADIQGKYKIHYLECPDHNCFVEKIQKNNYCFVIFNYHQITTPWICSSLTRMIPSAIFTHDTIIRMDKAGIIHADPSFVEKDCDFKIVRPVPTTTRVLPKPLRNTIGTFGFGFEHKGFYEIIERVAKEFSGEDPLVRIRVPFNTSVDLHGTLANNIKHKSFAKAQELGVRLEVYHEYLSKEDLIDWLAENTINCFFYRNSRGLSSGCSSTTDWAVASKRPFAVTKDNMFRHVLAVDPKTCVDDYSLKEIISRGFNTTFSEQWNGQELYKDFCRIADKMRGI